MQNESVNLYKKSENEILKKSQWKASAGTLWLIKWNDYIDSNFQ